MPHIVYCSRVIVAFMGRCVLVLGGRSFLSAERTEEKRAHTCERSQREGGGPALFATDGSHRGVCVCVCGLLECVLPLSVNKWTPLHVARQDIGQDHRTHPSAVCTFTLPLSACLSTIFIYVITDYRPLFFFFFQGFFVSPALFFIHVW